MGCATVSLSSVAPVVGPQRADEPEQRYHERNDDGDETTFRDTPFDDVGW